MKQWLLEILHWMIEGKILFMCILVIAATVTLGFITWCNELSIRASGYALQLIGMVFAIRGLLGIRAHFDQPLLRIIFIDWLKRFPKWKRKLILKAGAGTFKLSDEIHAEVWMPDNPDFPIEKRIEGIIRNLDRIRNNQREHEKLIGKLVHSHEEQKKQVVEQIRQLKSEVHTDLESLHTSDLITSLVGLVWLTVGITMSTLAPELYQWFK